MQPTPSLMLTGAQLMRLSDDRRRYLASQWGGRAPRLSEGATAARGLRLPMPWHRRGPAEC